MQRVLRELDQGGSSRIDAIALRRRCVVGARRATSDGSIGA